MNQSGGFLALKSEYAILASVGESPISEKKAGKAFLAILCISWAFNLVTPVLMMMYLPSAMLSSLLDWAESVSYLGQRVSYLRVRSELSAVSYVVCTLAANIFGILLGIAIVTIFKKYAINTGEYTRLPSEYTKSHWLELSRGIGSIIGFGFLANYYMFWGTPGPEDHDRSNVIIFWPWFSILVCVQIMFIGGVIFVVIATALKFLAQRRE